MNSPFVPEQAKALAARAEVTPRPGEADRGRCTGSRYGRSPTAEEVGAGARVRGRPRPARSDGRSAPWDAVRPGAAAEQRVRVRGLTASPCSKLRRAPTADPPMAGPPDSRRRYAAAGRPRAGRPTGHRGLARHHLPRPGTGVRRPSGYLGVTVFFVLSGYLITTLALREEAERGRLNLTAFSSAGRAASSRSTTWCSGSTRPRCSGPAPADAGGVPTEHWRQYAFYFQEVPTSAGSATCRSPRAGRWAIEEKFYLVWPVVAFGRLRPCSAGGCRSRGCCSRRSARPRGP